MLPSISSSVSRLSVFSSLKNPSFRWFWIGMIGSFSGMQMQVIAQGWLVYDMTGSALALGLVSAAWGFPVLVLSLLGGAIVDRVDKRKLLMITQSMIGAITLVVAVLVVTDNAQIWHLLASSLATGVVFAFNMPARQAIIPELVEESSLMNGIALNSAAMNLTRIAAPALGGVLIELVGAGTVYFIMVACYVFVVGSLLMVQTSRNEVAAHEVSLVRSVADGLRITRARTPFWACSWPWRSYR